MDIIILFIIHMQQTRLEKISRYFPLLVASCLVIIVNGLIILRVGYNIVANNSPWFPQFVLNLFHLGVLYPLFWGGFILLCIFSIVTLNKSTSEQQI